MSVSLAILYHDPKGGLLQRIQETLPFLTGRFAGIAVMASPTSSRTCLELFERAGAVICKNESPQGNIDLEIGGYRAAALSLALQFPADNVLQIDGDRALHWAARYPDELSATLERLSDASFTVLGRTPRAFASHPRPLRETELEVNQLFSTTASCRTTWDVMVGARGFSRRAAGAVLANCTDRAISVDVSWPLFLQKAGFDLQYLEVDGLEYETADRLAAEIEASGGLEAWKARRDTDPRSWSLRFYLAHLHAEAMIPYSETSHQ